MIRPRFPHLYERAVPSRTEAVTADGRGSADATPGVAWAVSARHVYAGYDNVPVLVDINLELPERELIAFIGPNGAGKSTFFKLLIGIMRPMRGDLQVYGEPVDRQRRQSRIAYMPQHEQIDWDFPVSVWDIVLSARTGRIRTAGGWRRFLPPTWTSADHTEAAQNALEAVDMLPYRNRSIGALSGGQKKRVLLARALAQDAHLLLLDEPLVGVDQASEELIFDVLLRARREGRTPIMVTHDLTSARQHADRVVLINRTVVACGPPERMLSEELLARTATVQVEQQSPPRRESLDTMARASILPIDRR